MTTVVQHEIVPKPEQEAQEGDEIGQESFGETTKELFRRDPSPSKDESPERPKTPPPTSKSLNKPSAKRELATKKKSNSGIPLRLKSGATTGRSPKSGAYKPPSQQPLGPVINKNTLEVQFMNNKKRLLKLHSELVEKQRPLVEMHKSLLRTKKQLEELGKKVVLEDLKILSLKSDDFKTQLEGGGENPAAETAVHLKSSIENTLEECVKVCKKCLVKRDHVVKILENASKSTIEPAQIEAEVQELKKDKEDSEECIESIIKENEKKISGVINDWLAAMSSRTLSDETKSKIADLENTIKQQQKAIQEQEDNAHSMTRKFDERRANYEKTISEAQEKNNKLEEELKKEKKVGNENLMKSRNMRSKVAELETRSKDAEEKGTEMGNKLKQLQDQLRRKEVQWLKEREDFKKNEALLQQKFSEKQSQFDTRLKDLEEMYRLSELEKSNHCRNYETQMEIKDQEFDLIEKERDALEKQNQLLEDQLEKIKNQMHAKDKEIELLKTKSECLPELEARTSDTPWLELLEYKQKVSDVQCTVEQQTDQISKMQSSLKAHAKLAAALKVEKDNAIKYSSKLRDILQEARDELDFKNKTIYKIHEKLVLKDKAYEKLKKQLNDFQEHDRFADKWTANKCQICMASLGAEKPGENTSCLESEVGKSSVSSPQYVTDSLIGMSVKKVDHLRARLDNLKKMKLPRNSGKKQLNVKYSWSSCETKPVTSHLRKQIELRGKLYQILQKHADQSCEDFINLLKLTVSGSGKGVHIPDELKPSNMRSVDETMTKPRNVKIAESYNAVSSYFGHLPLGEICDSIQESGASDTDEMLY